MTARQRACAASIELPAVAGCEIDRLNPRPGSTRATAHPPSSGARLEGIAATGRMVLGMGERPMMRRAWRLLRKYAPILGLVFYLLLLALVVIVVMVTRVR